ncbi:shikimate kinase [Striga asiatica]|uniref:Shikimate kinase n=1 Tax=Striga asiatica TaxID=4170 RepID=A0A5A7PI15_STRAF|nr:shikimate kinase [Striga asiatica]
MHAHLLHGMRKRVVERLLISSIEIHKRLRPRVRSHGLVARQQPHPSLQVHKVRIVEPSRAHWVIKRRNSRVRTVARAKLPEPARVLRVHARIVMPVEYAVGELGAVGEADGVGARERNHLLDGEPLGLEHGDDGGDGHVGEGDVAGDVGCAGVEAVLAAEADGVVRAADHGDEVAGGLREDVRAGYGMMGSGKTTIGKVLAEALGYSFYDFDKMIEEAVGGRTVAEIFKSYGEKIFRDNEIKVPRVIPTILMLKDARGFDIAAQN